MTQTESKRLEKVENKIDDLSEQVAGMQKSIDKIVGFIEGDNLRLDDGLKVEFNQLKTRVQKLERFKYKIGIIASTIGAILGFALSQFKDTIISIFK